MSLLRSGLPLGVGEEGSKRALPEASPRASVEPRVPEFFPHAPKSLSDAGLNEVQVEALILKVLLHRGVVSGRRLCEQIALPFAVIGDMMRRLKTECLVAYRASTSVTDYEYELTGAGVERARRFNDLSTYHGAAPVSLSDYETACNAQSILLQKPGPEQVRAALADLIVDPVTLNQLGQAVRSARAMFIYGSPGNGKTSIAERISRAFGKSIWVPRAINFDGEVVRVFDPIMHVEDPLPDVVLALKPLDTRWVRIRRPTVIAGGEMTLANLELTPVAVGGVSEAPLQLKSNGGVLVVDDFGRQRISAAELLNRWIVPLERRHDFLDSSCGRKVKVPFDQLVIFSTNLDPDELVDEAFLRRIPYKIELKDPTEAEFRAIFRSLAPTFGVNYDDDAVTRLIAKHYTAARRNLRSCHPRDLLQQVVTLCEYNGVTPSMSIDNLEQAVSNYFTVARRES